MPWSGWEGFEVVGGRLWVPGYATFSVDPEDLRGMGLAVCAPARADAPGSTRILVLSEAQTCPPLPGNGAARGGVDPARPRQSLPFPWRPRL